MSSDPPRWVDPTRVQIDLSSPSEVRMRREQAQSQLLRSEAQAASARTLQSSMSAKSWKLALIYARERN
jgi:hypothetical protein